MPKKYTEEQLKFVKGLVSRKENPLKVTPAAKLMCEKFGIEYNETVGRSMRAHMQKQEVTKNVKKIEDSDEFKKAAKKKFDKRRKRFVISWAQNATPVHNGAFESMIAYAKFHKAGIHIIAGRYRNPTSIWTMYNQEEERWNRKVLPYLDANRHNIHPLLQILSDVKVQPTAATPLSGMQGITGKESCIIGHPRLHMESLPVLDNYPNKLLMTTGAITIENYTDSKAGKKGEFHHQLGFVMVELDGDHFHIRQISMANDGSFYDLKYFVKDGQVYENHRGAEAVILGDVHNLSTDPKAMKVSEKMLNFFDPAHTLVHDLFDGIRINPHARKKDPYVVLEQELSKVTLDDEIDSMLEWCEKYKHYNLVIVRSNHDDFFDRFLQEDWRKLPDKATYLRYASVLAERKAPKGIIPYIIDQRFQGEVKALGIDDGYEVLGWELGVHGHLGSSGSRGSATQFKNLNTKTVTGHTHTPRRIDGHISVGTLTFLRLGYNKGMSPWMQSNVVIYPNGKAQHLHIVNGKFTTFKL